MGVCNGASAGAGTSPLPQGRMFKRLANLFLEVSRARSFQGRMFMRLAHSSVLVLSGRYLLGKGPYLMGNLL